MPPMRILVVDDVPEFLAEMRKALSSGGWKISTCQKPENAFGLLARSKFHLLITTLVMRELSGFELIRKLRGAGNPIPILMITGYGGERASIEATRLGASDYMEKPVVEEEVRARVKRLLELESDVIHSSPEALSHDAAMQSIFETIEIVAGTSSRVLILGETGTGKQLIARAIHKRSRRAAEPFLEVNCAAIPSNLLESELFGHERGSFTGATERRIGRFEEAASGTLFLDELGELDYHLQSKLLRVLQSGEFNRVGGHATLRTKARVIAATNRDLQKEVDEGRFRADLFYRLNVVTITPPPLRRRPGDVPLLAAHFARRFAQPRNGAIQFSPAALRALMRYPWPGNVRELEHLVERLSILSRKKEIGLNDIPDRIRQIDDGKPAEGLSLDGPYREARQRFEKEYLRNILEAAGGNLAEGARVAGMDRSQFFRMVKKHRLGAGERQPWEECRSQI